jgi:hypothetical protein
MCKIEKKKQVCKYAKLKKCRFTKLNLKKVRDGMALLGHHSLGNVFRLSNFFRDHDIIISTIKSSTFMYYRGGSGGGGG